MFAPFAFLPERDFFALDFGWEVGLWLELLALPELGFCFFWSTTVGASDGAAGAVVVVVVVVAAGVVLVEVVPAGGVLGVVEVSVVLVGCCGVVSVVLVVLVVEVPVLAGPASSASAFEASGPPRPAVSPPPASADSSARSIRRRTSGVGGASGLSLLGLPIVVAVLANPHSRDRPTAMSYRHSSADP